MGDLYEIAMLIDQLKDDDVKLRVNAAGNLVRMAAVLGPDRTRNELIPYIINLTDDDEKVVAVIAEKIGDLCIYVGDFKNIHFLLQPLEALASVEDVNTRKAVRSGIWGE